MAQIPSFLIQPQKIAGNAEEPGGEPLQTPENPEGLTPTQAMLRQLGSKTLLLQERQQRSYGDDSTPWRMEPLEGMNETPPAGLAGIPLPPDLNPAVPMATVAVDAEAKVYGRRDEVFIAVDGPAEMALTQQGVTFTNGTKTQCYHWEEGRPPKNIHTYLGPEVKVDLTGFSGVAGGSTVIYPDHGRLTAKAGAATRGLTLWPAPHNSEVQLIAPPEVFAGAEMKEDHTQGRMDFRADGRTAFSVVTHEGRGPHTRLSLGTPNGILNITDSNGELMHGPAASTTMKIQDWAQRQEELRKKSTAPLFSPAR